ncbi:MAG TPA: NADH-quinone oxidoreductase subunit N [Nitriliruptorales bacterium]
MLAQTAGATPEIAWSSFAPELLVAGVALALLLFTVARDNRIPATVIVGLLGLALGAWLLSQELWIPGGTVVGLSALATSMTIGFEGRHDLSNVWIAGLAALGALLLTGWQWVEVLDPQLQAVSQGLSGGLATQLQGSVAHDGIAFFTRITVYVTVLLVLPVGYGYLRDREIYRPEVEPLVLLAATGMALLGAAGDLIVVFIAVEMLSFALYVLVGLARRDRRSQEAALKYFVTGAVASALLVYGMALLYAATGTVDIAAIGQALGLVTTPDRVAVLGVALVIVGFAFKVALVPFHLWTPDVYQGAPTSVTAFMSAATKAAGFAAVLRLFLLGFGRLEDVWVPALAVIAALTMMIGAIAAVVQRDVKRILAYSSLAHAGYAAIGVAAGSAAGLSATLWYLLTYAVTTVASFGAVVAIERRRRGEVSLVDLKGLGRTSPALAALFSLSLLSLAGIPPTAGFQGKLAVFTAGVESDLTWLVVIGVVSSVIAAFFYLRLMAMMFLEEAEEGAPEPVVSTGLSAGLAAASAAIVVLGVIPATFLTLAEQAAVLAR